MGLKFCRALALRVWSPGQQHQQHLGTWEGCKFSALQTSLPSTESEILRVGPVICAFTGPPGDCHACLSWSTTVPEYCGVIMVYYKTFSFQGTVFLPSGNKSPVSFVCKWNPTWVCSLRGWWCVLTDKCDEQYLPTPHRRGIIACGSNLRAGSF